MAKSLGVLKLALEQYYTFELGMVMGGRFLPMTERLVDFLNTCSSINRAVLSERMSQDGKVGTPIRMQYTLVLESPYVLELLVSSSNLASGPEPSIHTINNQ